MIRQATIHDLDQLVPFAQQTFEAAFGALWNPHDLAHYFATSYSPEQLTKELTNPNETFWFLEEDGILQGFLQLEKNHRVQGVTGNNPLFLHRIYVDNTQTGNGFGTKLMQHAVKEAERGNHDSLWLGVWDVNPRAVALYRRWQFRKLDYVSFPFGSDIEPTDFLMQRDIGNIRVIPFADPHHARQAEFIEAFKHLNLMWLQQYFEVEPIDEELLGDPKTHILDKGGEIFFLLENEEIKGTCAMIPENHTESRIFELGKMAVHPTAQGRGFANLLMDAAIAHAKAERAAKIVLSSSTKLPPALKLYEKYGFVTTWTGFVNEKYKRGDIGMEKIMDNGQWTMDNF